ncbi:MAG: FliH/SctL family protein [Symbiobacteriaceae bacterium]|nr:FliH/SctL family protein [Symbiobacteriaceae bacterium]
MSRIIKATYVRLEGEPVQLENPVLVIETLGESETGEETRPEVEDIREKQIHELYERRLSRIQEMEHNLEEQRLYQLNELKEAKEKDLQELAQQRRKAAEELAALREQELTAARSQGHEQGRVEGRQAAFEEAQSETEAIREQALEMLREAAQEARRRVIEGEQALLEITLAVASRVLEDELNQRPETTLQLIRQALGSFKQVPQVIIRVPQSRYPLIQENLAKLKEEFRQVLSLDCLADATLPLTDIVVDSPFGMMDVRFDAQLEILREALLQELKV